LEVSNRYPDVIDAAASTEKWMSRFLGLIGYQEEVLDSRR
jgi:hypothetical protein